MLSKLEDKSPITRYAIAWDKPYGQQIHPSVYEDKESAQSALATCNDIAKVMEVDTRYYLVEVPADA